MGLATCSGAVEVSSPLTLGRATASRRTEDTTAGPAVIPAVPSTAAAATTTTTAATCERNGGHTGGWGKAIVSLCTACNYGC
jgi:hypothetical protein